MESLFAGVDEVGRGPLAGPVLAGAVILDPNKQIRGLTDSKLLTEERRFVLAERIKERAIAWAIGRAEVEEIDRLNILQATLLAMRRAVEGLSITPSLVMVDGDHCPQLSCEAQAVINGDELVPAISAASIIAKVARDAEMVMWDEHYPGYGFGQHKGYGTKMHLDALKKLGVTPLHRRSFKPVREQELIR